MIIPLSAFYLKTTSPMHLSSLVFTDSLLFPSLYRLLVSGQHVGVGHVAGSDSGLRNPLHRRFSYFGLLKGVRKS